MDTFLKLRGDFFSFCLSNIWFGVGILFFGAVVFGYSKLPNKSVVFLINEHPNVVFGVFALAILVGILIVGWR